MGAGEPIGEGRAVRRARSGSPDALAELYRRHAAAVYATAHRLTGSDADAEDILQEVFVHLPETLGKYDEEGSFEGWLRRVTARTCLMLKRTRRRRREVSLPPLRFFPFGKGPPEAVDTVALRRAMAELPEKYRLVFVLKEVEGYSHAEVAELLGISVSASQSALCRARGRLRRALAD